MARRPSSSKKLKAKKPARPSAKKPASTTGKAGQWVYIFGAGKAQGRSGMKDLLGGKGANLAEMAALGLPVPPGFTITTEVCRHVMAHGAGRYPDGLDTEVGEALRRVEELTKTSKDAYVFHQLLQNPAIDCRLATDAAQRRIAEGQMPEEPSADDDADETRLRDILGELCS